MKTGQRFSILFLLLAGFFLLAGAQEDSMSTSFSASNSQESSRKLKYKVTIRIGIRQKKIKGQNQIKNFLTKMYLLIVSRDFEDDFQVDD